MWGTQGPQTERAIGSLRLRGPESLAIHGSRCRHPPKVAAGCRHAGSRGMRMKLQAPLLLLVATIVGACSYKGSAELVVLEHDLAPGKRGTLTAEFQEGGSVFREPYSDGESVLDLRLGLAASNFTAEDEAAGRTPPRVLLWSGNDTVSGVWDPEFVSVETLDARRFRFVMDVPADFGPGPYLLIVFVRPGDFATPIFWPSYEERVLIEPQ